MPPAGRRHQNKGLQQETSTIHWFHCLKMNFKWKTERAGVPTMMPAIKRVSVSLYSNRQIWICPLVGVRAQTCGCVSYHYQRCLKSPRTKLEETAPGSPRHLPTSTVGGRQGEEHDGKATSINLWSRWVNISTAAQTDRAYLTAADVQV